MDAVKPYNNLIGASKISELTSEVVSQDLLARGVEIYDLSKSIGGDKPLFLCCFRAPEVNRYYLIDWASSSEELINHLMDPY